MNWPAEMTADMRLEEHFGRSVRAFAQRPRNLVESLQAAVGRCPGKVALALGEQRMTYAEFWRSVQSAAAGLARQAGMGAGDRVAVLCGNRMEFVIWVHAAWYLGAAAVPLNTRLQTHELKYMLENSGARVLLADPQFWPQVEPVRGELPDLGRVYTLAAGEQPPDTVPFAELLREPPAAEPATVGEDELACILYTSGTTGLPKGAMLTHFNLVHSVMHYARTLGTAAADTTLVAVPLFHVTGMVAQLLHLLYLGGTVAILPEYTTAGFIGAMAAHRATHTLSVPTIYVLMLKHPSLAGADLSHWRIAAFGGAPMPAVTIRELAERFPGLQLINVYGATETASPATLLPPADAMRKAGSVGLPLPAAAVKVVNPRGRELPAGEPGELWIRGPMVIPGYWGNPGANAQSFADGYWRSGDVATIDAEGYVYILDRLKDMINRGGEKVYSVEVESVLYQLPSVLEAAVYGVPDPIFGERVRAVIVPQQGATPDPEEVRSFAAARLADYKVPDTIKVADRLPRNPGGKVMKHLLRQADGA